jgi:DNA-binding NarL/FixJ family response regulator
VKRARVLLADDHPGVAKTLGEILSEEFDLVGVVEDGLSMLDAAERLEPDVIVADVSMPKLDGLTAFLRLKANGSAVKVVFITMHHEPAIADLALSAGALGFVLKHSAFTELNPAVRAAVEGKTFVSPALMQKSVSK